LGVRLAGRVDARLALLELDVDHHHVRLLAQEVPDHATDQRASQAVRGGRPAERGRGDRSPEATREHAGGSVTRDLFADVAHVVLDHVPGEARVVRDLVPVPHEVLAHQGLKAEVLGARGVMPVDKHSAYSAQRAARRLSLSLHSNGRG
jgi:hypothetical protein